MLPPFACRLAVAVLLAALTMPRMAQRGMFGDGLVYATIARNLAIGSGSFWAPRYTETAWAEFYEHPPLGLALQAAAFGLLGDHLIVERAFSLIVLGLHALVIVLIWRRVQPAALDWLPLLFWIVPSIVTWGAVNNMLENTQALFTTTAVLMMLVALRTPGPGGRGSSASVMMHAAAAGMAVVAAVLTKGPVGFFPLAAPLLFAALLPERPVPTAPKRVMTIAVASGLVVAAFAIVLAVYPPSRRNLTMYFGTHLAPALQGLRDVSEPLAIFRHLVIGVIGRMTMLLAACWWLARRDDGAADDGPLTPTLSPQAGRGSRLLDLGHGPDAPAFCFLALGLCAALPIAISPKVSGHYLLPAIPMFALGFASIARGFAVPRLRPRPAAQTPRTSTAILMAAFALAAIITLVFAFGPGRSRDAVMLHDLDAIDRVMPRDVTIGACRHPRSSRDWGLHTYAQRWFRVSLDARDMPINGWLLRVGEDCDAPPSCPPVARGDTLTLFRCPPHAPAMSTR
jgi:4-amino-4-deoxy-L-arabinose transferase-like glycosyltransferase